MWPKESVDDNQVSWYDLLACGDIVEHKKMNDRKVLKKQQRWILFFVDCSHLKATSKGVS